MLRQTVRYFRNFEKSLIRFREIFWQFWKFFGTSNGAKKNQTWPFMLAKHLFLLKFRRGLFHWRNWWNKIAQCQKYFRRSTKTIMVSTRLKPLCSCSSNLGIRTGIMLVMLLEGFFKFTVPENTGRITHRTWKPFCHQLKHQKNPLLSNCFLGTISKRQREL